MVAPTSSDDSPEPLAAVACRCRAPGWLAPRPRSREARRLPTRAPRPAAPPRPAPVCPGPARTAPSPAPRRPRPPEPQPSLMPPRPGRYCPLPTCPRSAWPSPSSGRLIPRFSCRAERERWSPEARFIEAAHYGDVRNINKVGTDDTMEQTKLEYHWNRPWQGNMHTPTVLDSCIGVMMIVLDSVIEEQPCGGALSTRSNNSRSSSSQRSRAGDCGEYVEQHEPAGGATETATSALSSTAA